MRLDLKIFATTILFVFVATGCSQVDKISTWKDFKETYGELLQTRLPKTEKRFIGKECYVNISVYSK